MTRSLTTSLVVGLLLLSATPAAAKPAPDLAAGREAYVTNCARCHGETGRGDGPDAKRMVPRPRDFSMGSYKYRTTASGTPPTDDDLFQTITYGLAGTRMPGWEGLSEETRWQLVAYVKSLSPKFESLTPQPVEFGHDPGPTGINLAKGKQLYADLGCAACHGAQGRADGPSAKTLVDDWSQPIRPINLTHGWTYRWGAEPPQIVARLMTGLDGTPMPSYAESVATEDLWQLAYYLRSIQEPVEWRTSVTATKVATLPTSPSDPAWSAAPRTDVKLWSNLYVGSEVVPAAIPWAVIQALATDEAVAFRIGWDDPSEDKGAPPDQLALVFRPETGSWSVGSLQSWPDLNAPGLDVTRWSAAASTDAAQYEEGRWWLTVVRPVSGTLVPDTEMPFALVIWDGGHGDTERQRSVSTWLDLHLTPPPTPKEKTHASH